MIKSIIKIHSLLVFFFLTSAVSAQKIELGEISKEDLMEKSYPSDSSANAAYLYKYRNTYIDGRNLVTEVHHKIKIYNKEGFDYATKKLRLYKNGSSREAVLGLKAFTYNLVGNEIVKKPISKESIFKTEYHKRQNHYTFTMPDVKEGSIIEYKYRINSPFYTNIDEYKFQHSIPVRKLYSKLYTPAFFKYKKKTKGFLLVIPKNSFKRDARIGVNVNITEYEMSNVPALKDEPFVDNIENYKAGVEYELIAIKYTTHTKYYAQSWDDVAKSVNEYDTYKNQINKKSHYKDDIDNLVAGITNSEEKMIKIFDFVKSKIKWNKVEGIYTFNGLPKAYKTGLGNVSDINLNLISMLRYVGLKANPILLSTKDNGIPIFPTIDGLNYVICGVELNGKVIRLDAADKYSSSNILSTNVMNWQGKLIRTDDTYKDIYLTSGKLSLTITFMHVKIDPSGSLNGKIRTTYKDNSGHRFRENYAKTSNEDYLLELESQNENIEISDFKLDNLENNDKPIVESYSYVKDEHIESIEDKMYLSPMLFLKSESNPFVLEKRLFPIDFSFPWNRKYQVQLEIPEGYTIESLPEPILMKMPEGIGEFSYNLKRTSDTKIQLVCSTKINQSKLGPKNYEFLKNFYNQMIKKQEEKIILKKI